MGLFDLAGTVFNHLLKTVGDFFFFLFVLGDIAADMDKFLDFSVFFPDGINVDLIVTLFTVRHQPGLNFTDLAFVADNLFERTVA